MRVLAFSAPNQYWPMKMFGQNSVETCLHLSPFSKTFHATATGVMLSMAFVFVLGCDSKTGSPKTPARTVAATATSVSIDGPQWLDVATAVPVTIAVRPDGRQAIAHAPPVTHAYELPSGKRLHTWPQYVRASYSGDGKTVLTVSDSVTSISDTKSFRIRQTFPCPLPYNVRDRPPFSAAISHDGSRIALTDLSQASGYYSPSVVRVFDCSTGMELLSIVVPEATRVQSLDFLFGGKRLLVQYSGPGDPRTHGARHLWDIKSSRVIAEFADTAKVIVSKNRERIAVGKTGHATKITVHDAETGKQQHQFLHPDVLIDFTFRPDTQQILMASTIPGSSQNFTDLADSPVAKDPISHIRQWDIATSKITFEQVHHEFLFAGAMYNAEGDQIFGTLAKPTGLDEDLDWFLLGWNAKTSDSIKTMPQALFTYEYGQALFVPGSNNMIALKKPLSIRNVITGEEVSPLARYRIAQAYVQFKANEYVIYSGASEIDLQTGMLSASWPVGPNSQFVQDDKTLFNFQHPSLNLIASESGDQIWNLVLTCASYPARDNCISNDARYIVRSQPGRRGSVAQSRVLVIRPEAPNSPTILHRYASRIAIHPSDLKFAIASDQSIEEFDIGTCELIGKIGDVPGRVLDLAYTADGSQIAACGVVDNRDPQKRFSNSNPGWVWLFDCQSQQVGKLDGHSAVVTSLAFDPPRNRLATSSHDGTVRLWDTNTRKCLRVYRGHHREVNQVDISSDGRLLVSAGADGVAAWNVAKVVDTDATPAKLASKLTVAKPSQKRQRISGAGSAVGSEKGNSPQRPRPAHGQATWDVVKVGDTSRVHFHTRSVDLWLQENGKAHRVSDVNKIPQEVRVPLAFSGPSSKSSDGKLLLFTDFRGDFVKVFDSDHKLVQSWPIRTSERKAVISPDGRQVFVMRESDAHRSGKIHVESYDIQSGGLAKTIVIDARWGTDLNVDPLGRTLMVRFDNNSIDLREVATGKSLAIFKSGPSGGARLTQYSPDGQLVGVCEYPSSEISLCDPLTLKPIQTFTTDLPVQWFRFTPDGTRILVGQPYARSRTLLTMWEIDHSAAKVRRLWSHAGPAGDMGQFSDDGHRYLSVENWNMWTLWDTEHGHVDVAIITNTSNSKDQFALAADGESVHFYTPDGPQVWRKQR